MAARQAPMGRQFPDAANAEDGQQPRYLQIVQALRERIAEGHYALGELIPTEAELCGEFQVSRFTIREALRRLVDSGMVERRKGSGTFVTSVQPRTLFTQSMRSLSELFQYALETSFEISESTIATVEGETAELLAADAGTQWLRIVGIRRVRQSREPISYTVVHVDGRFAPLLDDVHNLRTPIYAAVEARSGVIIAEALQEIRAEPMAPEIAAGLECASGFALLVRRRYIGRDGRTLLCSQNWHPAERFSYQMRIQREDFPG